MDFGHIGEAFAGIVWWARGCSAPTREHVRGKSPGFDYRCGAPVQHILLDIDDDEDDEHEEADKDDDNEDEDKDEDDEDDEDESEGEDDF